jgi:hypothetical protein
MMQIKITINVGLSKGGLVYSAVETSHPTDALVDTRMIEHHYLVSTEKLFGLSGDDTLDDSKQNRKAN